MSVLLSTVNFAEGGVSKALLQVIDICERNKIDYDVFVENCNGPYFKYINPSRLSVIKINNRFINRLVDDSNSYNSNISISSKFFILLNKVLRRIFSINFIFLLGSLYAEALKKDYDYVLDFHGYGAFSTYYLAYNYNYCKKYSWIHDEKASFLKHNIIALKRFNSLVCVSKSCENKVYDIIPEGINVQLVHNIINKNELIQKANAFKVKFTKPTILTVGRLEIQKGFDIIPKIARRLKEDGLNFQWLIIGSGSLFKDIEEEITKNNVSDNVKLLGFIENPMPYMKACYLYVQTSLHEGYPTTVSEALVMNKVIVGTNLPSMYEAIQSINEELLVNRDTDSMYNTIASLLKDEALYNYYKNKVINSSITYYEEEFLNLIS